MASGSGRRANISLVVMLKIALRDNLVIYFLWVIMRVWFKLWFNGKHKDNEGGNNLDVRNIETSALM